jgi:hypothetical protein
LKSGFPFHVDVQPLVTDFLSMCDGKRTALEAIEAFAKRIDADVERVTQECLKMIRKLVERGLMIAAPWENETAGPAGVAEMQATE